MNDNTCVICGGDSAKELKIIKILMTLTAILFITLLIGAYLIQNMV